MISQRPKFDGKAIV